MADAGADIDPVLFRGQPNDIDIFDPGEHHQTTRRESLLHAIDDVEAARNRHRVGLAVEHVSGLWQAMGAQS